jgi:hypothetical protein
MKRYEFEGKLPLKKLRAMVKRVESEKTPWIIMSGTGAALFFNARERLIREGCY